MPAATSRRTEAAALFAGALLMVAAVAVIYRVPIASYLFNDDFNWFDESNRFAFTHLVQLGRYNHFYRPLIEIYFFAGRQLFGCAALPFHLVSVGIHLLNTLILCLFARELSGSRLFAFLAALFFSTQPGYYEAVAWIAAITDLLPALWYLLALWLYARFLRRGGIGHYLAAFAACLLTHESSATVMTVLAAALTIRFAVYAEKSGPSFRAF